MEVANSVMRSLDQWELKQWDEAMVHASNAVDATAKKRYPQLGVATRFKRTIRDALDIFGLMAAPEVDLVQTRFPIAVKSDLPDERPDIADVLFGVHRHAHGHEDELPNGFELTPHGPRPLSLHVWRNGKVQLPAAAAIGLLAVAVFAPENKGEVIPDGYQLSWYQYAFPICLWWGWQDHFRDIIGTARIQQSPLDFAEFWDEWTPLAG